MMVSEKYTLISEQSVLEMSVVSFLLPLSSQIVVAQETAVISTSEVPLNCKLRVTNFRALCRLKVHGRCTVDENVHYLTSCPRASSLVIFTYCKLIYMNSGEREH